VIFAVRNDGPQDLESVTVYRPRTNDRITYPLAVTGITDYLPDAIDLGPLRLTEEAKFTLGCGGGMNLPEFRVRVECRSGADRWELALLLPRFR